MKGGVLWLFLGAFILFGGLVSFLFWPGSFPRNGSCGLRVALLVYGVRFVRHSKLQERVVHPLKADVFVFARHEGQAQEQFARSLGSSLKGYYSGTQPNPRHLLAAFDLAPNCTQWRDWITSSQDNYLTGGALLNYMWLQGAYELMASYEALHHFRYDWVIFARPDLEWLFDHPPVQLLNSTRVYVPTHITWGGIQTWTLTTPRKWASVHATKWKGLLDGSLYNKFVKQRLKCNGCNVEKFSHRVLLAEGARLRMYPSVSELVCDPGLCRGEDVCWSGKSYCKDGQHFRYPDWSLRYTLANADRMRKRGWSKLDISQDDFV